ncbi:hypothetical protein [Streptomyces sp. NPDC002209]
MARRRGGSGGHFHQTYPGTVPGWGGVVGGVVNGVAGSLGS